MYENEIYGWLKSYSGCELISHCVTNFVPQSGEIRSNSALSKWRPLLTAMSMRSSGVRPLESGL